MSSTPRAVLAGTGTAGEPAEAIDLMELAARRALSVSGASPRRFVLDAVLVPAGTWAYEDPGRELARRLGWPGTPSILSQLGISQQELINIAIERVTTGGAGAVLVVGGESRQWATHGDMSALPGTPDTIVERPEQFIDDLEIAAGLVFPAVRSYALLERAFDARLGLDDDEAARINAELWSAMSAVAAERDGTLVTASVPARHIAEISPTNRLLSAPYLRVHASQWTVDQAAALLVMNADTAHQAGVEPSAAVHPLVALESTDVVPVIHRAELSHWPAMAVLGEAATAHLGRPLSEIDLLDLYSCFPVAVRMQADELGLSLSRPMTVTGGMTFGGGPFNNYVLGSTATMAECLRSGAGATGMITTVSGLLTKPGLAVWSTTDPQMPGLIADLGHEAARRTARVTCAMHHEHQPLTIETSTAWSSGDITTAAVLGTDEGGSRHLALLHDPESFDRFRTASCIGEQL